MLGVLGFWGRRFRVDWCFVGGFEGRVCGCMAGSSVELRFSDYAGPGAVQTSLAGVAVSVQLAFRASLDLGLHVRVLQLYGRAFGI